LPIYIFHCPQCKAKYETLKRTGDFKQICPYCPEPTQMKIDKDTYKTTPPVFGLYTDRMRKD